MRVCVCVVSVVSERVRERGKKWKLLIYCFFPDSIIWISAWRHLSLLAFRVINLLNWNNMPIIELGVGKKKLFFNQPKCIFQDKMFRCPTGSKTLIHDSENLISPYTVFFPESKLPRQVVNSVYLANPKAGTGVVEFILIIDIFFSGKIFCTENWNYR